MLTRESNQSGSSSEPLEHAGYRVRIRSARAREREKEKERERERERDRAMRRGASPTKIYSGIYTH